MHSYSDSKNTFLPKMDSISWKNSLVLSRTVELSSWTFYDILDPCWEFMIDSKFFGGGQIWSETVLLYWCSPVLILLGLAQFVLPFLGWLCPAPWEWIILFLEMVLSFLKYAKFSWHWYCISLTSISTLALSISLLHYRQVYGNPLQYLDIAFTLIVGIKLIAYSNLK